MSYGVDFENTKAGLPRKQLWDAPVLDRLLFRVEKTSTCWLWKGCVNRKGYGHIRGDKNGPLLQVHRVSYEGLVGPIPVGLEIDHLCRVRHCVNPAHLEPVDHRTNVLRGRHNQFHGRLECQNGHPYTVENTHIIVRDGTERRQCRTCCRDNTRRYRERQRA